MCVISLNKYCSMLLQWVSRLQTFFPFWWRVQIKQTIEKNCDTIVASLYMFLHLCDSHLCSLKCSWTMQTQALINPTVSIFVFTFSLNFLPESLVYLHWQLPVPWRILNALRTCQSQSDSQCACECKQQKWIDLNRKMKINCNLAKILNWKAFAVCMLASNAVVHDWPV